MLGNPGKHRKDLKNKVSSQPQKCCFVTGRNLRVDPSQTALTGLTGDPKTPVQNEVSLETSSLSGMLQIPLYAI